MRKLFLAVSTALLATPPAWAGTPAQLEILPGWRAEDGTRIAALHIHLAPGWKTYWRAPGEAGLPPVFDWSASRNVAAIKVMWPVPQVFAEGGMTTFGYHDDVVLPIEITPRQPGADIALDGAVTMGVCKDICMPLDAHVSARLDQATTGPDSRITAALADQPATAADAGVRAADCSFAPIDDGIRVTAKLDLPPLGNAETVVVEGPHADIWVSEATTSRQGNWLTAVADLVPPEAKPFKIDPQTLRITVLAEGHGVDIEGCASAKP